MKHAPSINASIIATALFAVAPGIPISARNAADAGGAPTQIVITVQSLEGGSPPEQVTPHDFTALEGKTPVPVLSLERLAGDSGAMQLLILMDDSSPSSTLSVHFASLRTFLKALPSSTEAAIGYMRNGAADLKQSFTSDHEKAASALRLPLDAPGLNGSPYFVLSDLVAHWPSTSPAPRRAVLMLTDGVDRYFGASEMDDPYADAAIRDAQKHGVEVSTIYLRDSGAYDADTNVKLFAQSRLEQLARETGGYAYFQDFTNPVTLAPFLSDFADRLENQYRLTLALSGGKGLHELKVHTTLAGIKISAPTRAYVP